MKMRLSILVIYFCAAYPASLLALCTHNASTFSCLEYVDNYDGDTITFNIPKLHPLLGSLIKVRLDGLDTPEIRSKKPCEKELAYYTKDFVKSLLLKTQTIQLKEPKRGKYFRIIGEIWLDSVNLGELLLEKKLAIPYDGGHKPEFNWCDVSQLYLEKP